MTPPISASNRRSPPSDRTKVQRHAERGDYDPETVMALLEEGLVCHVGMIRDGSPVVIPMSYGLWRDSVVLHGAKKSQLMRALAQGAEASVAVTFLDALVLARSTFHHSMNYRSVVLFGRGEEVVDAEEKAEALEALVEHLVPGRSREARPADAKEIEATTVVRIPVREAAAKIRAAPPSDAPKDRDRPIWAGLLPMETCYGVPEPDGLTGSDIPLPDYLRELVAG